MSKSEASVSRIGLAKAFYKLTAVIMTAACFYTALIQYQNYRNYRFFNAHYKIEKVEVENFVGWAATDLCRCATITMLAKSSRVPEISWGPPFDSRSSENGYAVLTDAKGTEWWNANEGTKAATKIGASRWQVSYCNSRPTDIPITDRPLTLTAKLWVDGKPLFISVPAQPKIGRWNKWYLNHQKGQSN